MTVSQHFLYHTSNFLGTVMPTTCKHVSTFAAKLPKPAVGVIALSIFGWIIVSQTWASLLFSLNVIATVLAPA